MRILHREDYFSAIKSTFIAIKTGQSRWVLLVRKLLTKVMLDVFLKNCRIFVWKTVFHFSIGGAKGDERFEGENLMVKDLAAYRSFYDDITRELERKYAMASDHQRHHNTSSPNIFARKYEQGKGGENNIILRIAWSACLWDSRRIAIAKTLADALNRHFEKDVVKEYAPDLKSPERGY